MSNKILFVFEGIKTEGLVINSLQNYFVNENTTVQCVFGAEIYQIYKEIKADDDLDTFNLIKERNIKDNELLDSYTRDDFAEIYMFFDYDGHSSLAEDERLKELLDFFNEETDKGKLYVSYPMVESLKHIPDYESFKDLAVKCKENIGYKEIVSKEAMKHLINFNKYDIDVWKEIIHTHLKKMNFIHINSYTFPSNIISQLEIFSKQLEKYITPHSKVAVLSCFPIFLHDYYGNEEIQKRIK